MKSAIGLVHATALKPHAPILQNIASYKTLWGTPPPPTTLKKWKSAKSVIYAVTLFTWVKRMAALGLGLPSLNVHHAPLSVPFVVVASCVLPLGIVEPLFHSGSFYFFVLSTLMMASV